MEAYKKIPILHRIPLTRIKLAIARLLYRLVKIVIRDDNRIICRHGIRYRVDLSEGIDLSLFLFANFQSHVIKSDLLKIPNDAVVFDVGANIGSMSLQYAKIAGAGHVYAFEPTRYAFDKLTTNLSLNPSLAERITAVQVFISDQNTDHARMQAYSSWKINASAGGAHPLHGGTLKSGSENDAIPAVTLDGFCIEQDIKRLDYIKIDTDGHELKVLKGAAHTILQFQPVIIFEAGLYIFQEQNVSFGDYYSLFEQHGYQLYNAKNNKVVHMENYKKHIPLYYTTDIIAMPSSMTVGIK